jgi:integrase/recombinase XerC
VVEQGTHKPLVGSSNLPVTTNSLRTTSTDKGTSQKLQASSHISSDQGIGLKQAVEGFLLSCKVEGKSYGTIEGYTDKLKGFQWYARNYNWPDDVALITTNHLREFLVYLRESKHRFNSTCPRTFLPVNNTTIQKYYRALSVLFKWLINEELLDYNPLMKIKVPQAEKKIIKALSQDELSRLLDTFGVTFQGKRNRAMILVLADCGLRLGELLNLKTHNVNMNQQLLQVHGKTGERVVRFGSGTAKALLKYLMIRDACNGHSDNLWITKEGIPLKPYAVETIFRALSKKAGVNVHPHLLRHTFATLWLKNGGDSLMLQRLLGHTTLMMTNRYCQAVGCYDAIESHKKYSPVDNLGRV